MRMWIRTDVKCVVQSLHCLSRLSLHYQHSHDNIGELLAQKDVTSAFILLLGLGVHSVFAGIGLGIASDSSVLTTISLFSCESCIAVCVPMFIVVSCCDSFPQVSRCMRHWVVFAESASRAGVAFCVRIIFRTHHSSWSTFVFLREFFLH